jgi:hypothetical protein
MTRTGFASSRQDTLSGHEEDHGRKQESENLYVTIQEAARRCGVSNKTIQRAIHAGTLPARYPKPNRCEIAISDLECIRPGQVSGHGPELLEQRVAALEERVQQLEHLVEELLDRPAAQPRQSRAKARERTTGPLPKQFVSLLVFARHHNVAESTVQTHMGMGLLPIKCGEWTDTDGTIVTLALDAKGRAAFYQLYRSFPHFMKCHHCSHCYQDSVSGQEGPEPICRDAAKELQRSLFVHQESR